MGKISQRLQQNNINTINKNKVHNFIKYAVTTYKKNLKSCLLEIVEKHIYTAPNEIESAISNYLVDKWFEEITTKQSITSNSISVEVVEIIDLIYEEALNTKIKDISVICILKAYEELQIKLLAVDEKKLMEDDFKNLNKELPSKPKKDPFRP